MEVEQQQDVRVVSMMHDIMSDVVVGEDECVCVCVCV